MKKLLILLSILFAFISCNNDITKNSDTSYTYYDATEHAGMDFNFTSDTKGTFVDSTGTLHITKK